MRAAPSCRGARARTFLTIAGLLACALGLAWHPRTKGKSSLFSLRPFNNAALKRIHLDTGGKPTVPLIALLMIYYNREVRANDCHCTTCPPVHH